MLVLGEMRCQKALQCDGAGHCRSRQETRVEGKGSGDGVASSTFQVVVLLVLELLPTIRVRDSTTCRRSD